MPRWIPTTYVQNLREKTSGLKNCSVEVSKQESMSFGSSGVELRLSGPDLGDLETASESIRNGCPAWRSSTACPPP